jgi:hypothetical protein
LKSRPGPLASLGNAARAHVILTIWCRDCRHRAEPDPAEQAERYDAKMTVIDWKARLICSRCGSRQIDMVVIGESHGDR